MSRRGQDGLAAGNPIWLNSRQPESRYESNHNKYNTFQKCLEVTSEPQIRNTPEVSDNEAIGSLSNQLRRVSMGTES
jgi:hypothetical protein